MRSGDSTLLLPVWPGFDSRTRFICWLSLLLVLFLAPRSFSPDTTVYPSSKFHFYLGNCPHLIVLCAKYIDGSSLISWGPSTFIRLSTTYFLGEKGRLLARFRENVNPTNGRSLPVNPFPSYDELYFSK